MINLYTDQVKEYAKNLKTPWKGLRWDVVQYSDRELYIVLYRDNMADFPEYAMTPISEWVQKLIGGIRNMGIPCYLEVQDK